jgi:hypothetical protein
MSKFIAVCPISDDCPWESPSGEGVHEHIVSAHPEVLRDSADQKATGQAYKMSVFAKWRRAVPA